MKAVVIRKYGGPEELKFEDFPDPPLSPHGEVLIKTFAASINPVDIRIRSGSVKDGVLLDSPRSWARHIGHRDCRRRGRQGTIGDKVFGWGGVLGTGSQGERLRRNLKRFMPGTHPPST
jgi:NADPH:quinone reductase-like Zn-dependent oxidoreductase